MSYEKLLLYYAMPYFIISMLVELFYARWRGEHIPVIDTVSSLSSGMTNILKGTLGLSVSILSYKFLLQHVELFHWDKPAVWMYAFCFLVVDHTGYWVHRIEHRVNFFWNRHIIHHSSEEFNLACALRQSFSDFVGYFTIFYLPMSLLGIPVMVVAIVAPIHLFMQFWYHTKYINRLGFLEKVIVTPSHHRVHHAMNDIYMDKNFGQIFIFWDRLFGTYQEELAEVPAVYGVKRPVRTWNPFIINFKHFYLMAADAWHTKSMKDKLRVWFMPAGWRPADVIERYPVDYVADMCEFEKFNPGYSVGFMTWSFIQMIVTLGLLGFLFYRVGNISHTEVLVYGGFLLASIFAYTAVMDRKVYGVVSMVLVAAAGIAVVVRTGDWFGMTGAWPAALIAYWVFSSLCSFYFMMREFDREARMANG